MIENISCAPPARRTPSRRITGGKLTGQKPALKLKEVWAIRARLELKRRGRDLALFNLAIDSKLRACDLVRLRVEDVAAGGQVKHRAVIVQRKTGRPVQFEITEQTRTAVAALLQRRSLAGSDYRFQSRLGSSPHLSTRRSAKSPLRRGLARTCRCAGFESRAGAGDSIH